MHDQTTTFSVHENKERELKKTLTTIYDALKEKVIILLTKSLVTFSLKIRHT